MREGGAGGRRDGAGRVRGWDRRSESGQGELRVGGSREHRCPWTTTATRLHDPSPSPFPPLSPLPDHGSVCDVAEEAEAEDGEAQAKIVELQVIAAFPRARAALPSSPFSSSITSSNRPEVTTATLAVLANKSGDSPLLRGKQSAMRAVIVMNWHVGPSSPPSPPSWTSQVCLSCCSSSACTKSRSGKLHSRSSPCRCLLS